MKLILIRKSGLNRVVNLRVTHVAFLALMLVGGLAAGGFALVRGVAPDAVDQAVVEAWKAEVNDQQQMLEAIKARSQAESEALGKQLAQVQARLMRMEAIGQRMVDVADLGEGEFSFDEPAAVGGPTASGGRAMELKDLERSFSQLNMRLRDRESELAILESLLADEEYRDAVALEGRPVKWGWLSSPFGYRIDPISGQRAWHAGMDFAGKADSDVIAVASGVVTFAGERSGYGHVVEINHGDGLLTRYGHHASLKVKTGEIVKRGEVIGTMGSTGRSTGPHVHFEVEHKGRKVNPAKYLKRT